MESTSFLLGNRATLAAGIRRFRDRHQLSQSELAVLSGVSLRTIQGLEAESTRPSSLTIMRLDDTMRKLERKAVTA
jgi:transcriptional regulator with XRE-family HTH domain